MVRFGMQLDQSYSVRHDKLLLKPESIGLMGCLWGWFKCYLSSHFQFISVNNRQSSILPVLSGVPQGILEIISCACEQPTRSCFICEDAPLC